MNDGTCEDSCMEGPGFKCICIDGRMGDKCQNWTSKWKKNSAKLSAWACFVKSHSILAILLFVSLRRIWSKRAHWGGGGGGGGGGG